MVRGGTAPPDAGDDVGGAEVSGGGDGSRPITAWFLQVATVVSVLVVVFRGATPVDLLTVLVLSGLFSAALWRADWLFVHGRLDPTMVVLCLAMFAVLAGMNLVLWQRVDRAEDRRSAAETALDDLPSSTTTGPPAASATSTTSESATTATSSTSSAPSTTDAPTPPDGTATVGEHGVGPGIYENGNAELPDGGDRYFDLDAWEPWYFPQDIIDIGLVGATLSGHNGSALAPVVTPTFDRCGAADLAWVSYVGMASLEPGASFCVMTSDDRRAALTVTEIEDDGYGFAFVATVWDAP